MLFLRKFDKAITSGQSQPHAALDMLTGGRPRADPYAALAGEPVSATVFNADVTRLGRRFRPASTSKASSRTPYGGTYNRHSPILSPAGDWSRLRLRLRLLKLGGRVTETVSRIRLPLAPLVPRPACSAISPAPSSRPHRERRTPKPPNPTNSTPARVKKSHLNRGRTDALTLLERALGTTPSVAPVNKTG